MSSVSLGATRADTAQARMVFVAMAAIVGLGAGLRIAGASGSLWFDEIWSLQNLEGLAGPGGIVLDISQDNNHFLNSFWLWIAGPDAPPLVLRAISVAFGIASILMAARIACREAGPAGALIAALLFAASPILVQYGSEARGYSGMIFGLLWAFDALMRFLAEPRQQADRPRLEFALAVALGSLSHVQMLPAAGVLAAGAVVCIAIGTRSMAGTIRAARDLGSAFILGATPVCLALAAGLLNTHMFRFGDQIPFSLMRWIDGLAAMAQWTFGLPQAFGAIASVACVLGLAVLASSCAGRRIRILTGMLIVALPVAMMMGHVPNLHIPRFHLACALGLLLLFAIALAQLWTRGGAARAIVIVALGAFGAGAALNLGPFLQMGRGDYADAVRAMHEGAYATNEEAIAKRTMRFYAPRVGARLEWRPLDRCDTQPDWFIRIDDNTNRNPPAPAETSGTDRCVMHFRFVKTYPYAGLSGFRWSLYRRDDG